MMNAHVRTEASEAARPASSLLEVKNLTTEFRTERGTVRSLHSVSFGLGEGEALGLVGESGCGKSVTALSIMGLLPQPAGRIVSGEILFNGVDLTKLSDREMEAVRGKDIALIFQDALTSLNPVLTIERQITEAARRHLGLSPAAARRRAIEFLDLVGIPAPDKRISDYPHQFSGGMRQRVMIAMALVCGPRLLIADEPTTALDVTIQAQILELLQRLRKELSMALIMITHDLGVVAGIADRVNVMYAGHVVETGMVRQIFKNASHPYTAGLLGSIPKLDSIRGSKLQSIKGTPPDLANPPPGCPFTPRCSHAFDKCAEPPPRSSPEPAHAAECWLLEAGVNTADSRGLS
ncbi:oligopeptide transport system ATP-binding protein [Devosia sp. YR412]|uniref:ABC transporter ATP-binding protein n=1 Tax=Devosia sp. YR412 TaxID=1881030 RepID=UPI0008D00C2B|nr:ABC transporter ATP-binding protein [Devosia sp. YR412]SEQ10646.1 oligopeptide transport system ATP-binding protein [Devosia sp. YR412]